MILNIIFGIHDTFTCEDVKTLPELITESSTFKLEQFPT